MNKDNTILILGSGSDIARAIARKFASAGYNLQLAARNEEQLRRLQKDLEGRYGVTVSCHPFDAENYDSHPAFINGLPLTPNVVVYAAGVMHEQKDASESWNKAKNMIDVNYVGAISVLNLLATEFTKMGSGCIIGISSVAGERGRGSNYLYGSTKAAFTAYLSGLRNQLFEKGVRVITVKPGFVYTKMTREINLSPKLSVQPERVAEAIYSAVNKGKDVIYVKPLWHVIMLVIRCLPESIFKRTKL